MDYPGKPVKLGSKGPAVLFIQKALGFGRGGQTSEFGPTTLEGVVTFQKAWGLEPDGVVGPITWAHLAQPTRPVSIGKAALKYAQFKIGSAESPPGSNRGKFVDECNRTAGAPLGSFWCMSFVYWCVVQAVNEAGGEVEEVMPRTASCSALFAWAKKKKHLTGDPSPGDIFLCRGGETGHYHTGFVSSPVRHDGFFQTVEGNSNTSGSPNGIAVVARFPGRHVLSCDYVRL